MSEPTPYWPPPPTAPIGPDLTPTHTELQTLRTFHAQHEIDALLDASFAADYRPCAACGAMIGAQETQGVCYPCSQGNRARGPIYGASLAGHAPVPGDALRAVEAVWLDPSSCSECAELREELADLTERFRIMQADRNALGAQTVALRNAPPCHDCAAVADRSEALAARVDDLLDQNDAQAVENSDLARQVVSLKGHLEELAAQVRAGKLGGEQ